MRESLIPSASVIDSLPFASHFRARGSCTGTSHKEGAFPMAQSPRPGGSTRARYALASVLALLWVGCQSDAELSQAARSALLREAHAAEPAAPVCGLALPKTRTLVLRGSECAARPERDCQAGSSKAALSAELHALAQRCGAFQHEGLQLGATFRAGCASEVRLSAEIATDALRCMADALNASRLSCAAAVPCALSN